MAKRGPLTISSSKARVDARCEEEPKAMCGSFQVFWPDTLSHLWSHRFRSVATNVLLSPSWVRLVALVKNNHQFDKVQVQDRPCVCLWYAFVRYRWVTKFLFKLLIFVHWPWMFSTNWLNTNCKTLSRSANDGRGGSCFLYKFHKSYRLLCIRQFHVSKGKHCCLCEPRHIGVYIHLPCRWRHRFDFRYVKKVSAHKYLLLSKKEEQNGPF